MPTDSSTDMSAIPFRNRTEAGRSLSHRLLAQVRGQNVVVIAMPGGGIPVAYEVARALNAPLDVFLVQLIGVPGQEEISMGAIASGGFRVLDQVVIDVFGVTERVIEHVTAAEQKKLAERERFYRGDRPLPDLSERIVVFVDDGLTEPATLRSALKLVRKKAPARLIVAIPIGTPTLCQEISSDVDEVVLVEHFDPRSDVGMWYRHFAQPTDEQIHQLLEQSAQERLAPARSER